MFQAATIPHGSNIFFLCMMVYLKPKKLTLLLNKDEIIMVVVEITQLTRQAVGEVGTRKAAIRDTRIFNVVLRIPFNLPITSF